MLVLTRKTSEQIQIGENVVITILRVKGQAVRIGIEAPRDVRVLRAELPRNEPELEQTPPEMTVVEAAGRTVAQDDLAAKTWRTVRNSAAQSAKFNPTTPTGRHGTLGHLLGGRRLPGAAPSSLARQSDFLATHVSLSTK